MSLEKVANCRTPFVTQMRKERDSLAMKTRLGGLLPEDLEPDAEAKCYRLPPETESGSLVNAWDLGCFSKRMLFHAHG